MVSPVPQFCGSYGFVQESQFSLPDRYREQFSFNCVASDSLQIRCLLHDFLSILSLYTAGEFFFFSDLTCELVVIVFLFQQVFMPRKSVLIPKKPARKKTGDPNLWTRVLRCFLRQGQLEAACNTEIRRSVSSMGTGLASANRQLLACLPSLGQIKAQKEQLPAGRNVRK